MPQLSVRSHSLLEDLVERRWPIPVNGRDDVLEFAEVFLPDASTAIVDPGPFRVIVVDMALNLLGFQPLPIAASF